MGRSSAHDDLPPSDDPIWLELGAEVLEELKTPKTVSQLKDWARGERLEIGRLINTLAWLDMRGLVERHSGVEALWKRSERRPPIRRALPACCPHCQNLARWKAEPQRVACMVCGYSMYPPPDPNEPDNDGDFEY
jgi:hypothetical protein